MKHFCFCILRVSVIFAFQSTICRPCSKINQPDMTVGGQLVVSIDTILHPLQKLDHELSILLATLQTAFKDSFAARLIHYRSTQWPVLVVLFGILEPIQFTQVWLFAETRNLMKAPGIVQSVNRLNNVAKCMYPQSVLCNIMQPLI